MQHTYGSCIEGVGMTVLVRTCNLSTCEKDKRVIKRQWGVIESNLFQCVQRARKEGTWVACFDEDRQHVTGGAEHGGEGFLYGVFAPWVQARHLVGGRGRREQGGELRVALLSLLACQLVDVEFLC